MPLLLLSLLGCKTSDGVAAYAFDPIWLAPSGDGVEGYQTWELYADGWQKRYKPKFFVCSVTVSLDGTPAEPGDGCVGCDVAWRITPSILETDCPADVAERPGFLAVSHIGIGRVVPEIAEGNPYPAQSQGGFVDYATDAWVPHGWAYPESLDTQGQASGSTWDGEQPFQLWPAFYWDLNQAPDPG